MIDWDNLPVLIGPKRKRMIAERHDREKLARAKMRRSKGPKNHSTNRERSREERMKAARCSRAIAERTKQLTEYLAAVRAYWRGERETHPER